VLMNLLDPILNFFRSDTEDFYYVKFERNEKCYCNSGKKYKVCHYPQHAKSSRRAVRKISEVSGEETFKVLSIKRIRKDHELFKAAVIQE